MWNPGPKKKSETSAKFHLHTFAHVRTYTMTKTKSEKNGPVSEKLYPVGNVMVWANSYAEAQQRAAAGQHIYNPKRVRYIMKGAAQ